MRFNEKVISHTIEIKQSYPCLNLNGKVSMNRSRSLKLEELMSYIIRRFSF